MKVTIPRKSLDGGLTVVLRSIAARSSLPIMTNVLVEAGSGKIRLTGSDVQRRTEVTLAAKVEEDGAACVPARGFSDLTGAMREGDVLLQTVPKKNAAPDEGGDLFIRSGSSTYQIPGFRPEDYVASPEVSGDHRFTVGEKMLKRMLRSTVFGCSDDDTRPILQCVLLRIFPGDGRLVAVATDTHKMPVCEGKSDQVVLGGDEPVDFLIPEATVKELVANLSDDPEGLVVVYAARNLVVFECGGLRMYCQPMDGKFPKWERVVPEGCSVSTEVDRNPLMEVLRRVKVVARQGKNPDAIQLLMNERSLVVRAYSENLGRAREEIDAVRVGDDLRIAYNQNLFASALEALEGNRVRLEFNGERGASVVRSPDDQAFFAIIMPVGGPGFEDSDFEDFEDFALKLG